MNVTELKKEELNLELKVVIPSKSIDTEVQSELASLARTAKIQGFRPGKVPLSVIEKKYGDSVRGRVLNNKIQSSLKDIIKERKLNTVGDPTLDDVKMEAGKDLEFVLKFELVPEITMPDFKKISVEKPILEITEKDIEEKIEQLLDLSKKFEKESKGKAAKGDQIVIDAIGETGGKPFEGGKLDAYKLVIGSGVFIPGFEDQLIGLKAGSEVVVKVTFPVDYHASDLAGKEAEFKVKVLSVFKSEAPELNEEFAEQYGCKSVQELKEKLSTMLENQYAGPVNTMMKLHLFDQLEKMLKFNVPETLFNREFETLKTNTEAAKKSDEGLAKKSAKELEEYCKKLATRRVRIGLLLAEYAKQNNIQVTFDEIKQAVMNQARNFPGHEAAIYEYYKKNPSALSSLQGPLLEDKAVGSIFDTQVNLLEKKYSKKKLEELLDKEHDRDE